MPKPELLYAIGLQAVVRTSISLSQLPLTAHPDGGSPVDVEEARKQTEELLAKRQGLESERLKGMAETREVAEKKVQKDKQIEKELGGAITGRLHIKANSPLRPLTPPLLKKMYSCTHHLC